MLNSLLIFNLRDENYSCVMPACSLQSFQVSNLHCWLWVQFFCSFFHQLCRFYISFCRNYLAFCKSSLFCCTWKRILKFLTELYILDEDLFHLRSPFRHIPFHLSLDIIWDFLSFLKDILEDKLSTSIFKDSVGDFWYGML